MPEIYLNFTVCKTDSRLKEAFNKSVKSKSNEQYYLLFPS